MNCSHRSVFGGIVTLAFLASPLVAQLEWKMGEAAASDGNRVALCWAVPAGDAPCPVVIFLHGAPGGVGEEGLRRLLGSSRWPRWIEAGFAVCVADYRGHAPDKPFDVVKGETNATDDLAAVIEHLGAHPRLDLRRLVVTGQSLGGLIALEAVSRGKIAPAGVVASAPATFPFLGYRGGRGGRPDRDLSDGEIDRPATLARVAKITPPVLILQGTGDGLCALNKKLFEVMQAAGRDVRLELFEGAPHGFVNGPENEHYRRALEIAVAFAVQHTAIRRTEPAVSSLAAPDGRRP
jgi:dipeptidyl aminopeptidase/acylaminoacyl peptidase